MGLGASPWDLCAWDVSPRANAMSAELLPRRPLVPSVVMGAAFLFLLFLVLPRSACTHMITDVMSAEPWPRRPSVRLRGRSVILVSVRSVLAVCRPTPLRRRLCQEGGL